MGHPNGTNREREPGEVHPMSVPARNIESMNLLMTVVGGNIVYQREDFRPSVTMRGDSPTGLLPQRAGEQRHPGGYVHVLAAADGVGHGPGGDVAPDGNLP
jgi:hypothetical protein